ncbi:MAG: metallopeptidase family protein [Solirubrobacteraceae bacterium]
MDRDDDVGGLDERSFDALEAEVERLAAHVQEAREPPAAESAAAADPAGSEEDFERLVRSALDELPAEFQRALRDVAIVVSDDGHLEQAYGLYVGRTAGYRKTMARPDFYVLPDEILIYRDTLLRDFGHDPQLLRAQISRVVRHEVAHHLGFDEPGVGGLGL